MTTDTVDAVPVLRIEAGSVWGDSAMLVPELRIGVADGPEEYILGRITAIAVSPTGVIYLLDGQGPSLRAYRPDGRYLQTLGRVGSGPGEYRHPDGGLAVLNDGRVILRDPGNNRFEVYDAEGTFLEEWPLPGVFSTRMPLFRGDSDRLYTPVLLDDDAPGWRWQFGLARYTSGGAIVDTISLPGWDYEQPMIRGQSSEQAITVDVPFTPVPQWTLRHDGRIISGVPTEYALTLFEDTEPAMRIRKYETRVPVQAGEAAAERDRLVRGMREAFPDWTWNGPEIPDTKPAYDGLFTGQYGRLWVAVPGLGEIDPSASPIPDRGGPPVVRYRSPVRFDVFDDAGRFLGPVRTPAGFQRFPVPIFRGDTVWALQEDSVGVPQLVRYRLMAGIG